MKPITNLRNTMTAFKSGQTMAEYVLIVSAVAVALISGYHVMGASLTRMVEAIVSAL